MPGTVKAGPADFVATWAVAQGIEGWLTRSQALTLHRAAQGVVPGQWIVEIGSHRGRSTVVLARAAQSAVRVMAVDPWDDPRWGGGADSRETFFANLRLAGVEERVATYVGLSSEAAANWAGDPIGLVFVDGAHDMASVLVDIHGWEPQVAPGGLVCFHDAFSSVGVTLAVLRKHLLGRRFRYLGSVGSLIVFQRQELSAVSVLANASRICMRLPYFARNLMIKAALRHQLRSVARLLRHSGPGSPY